MSKRPYHIFFLLHFSFFIFTSCYEPQEGCLDIQATNYAVAADDPCTDCCTFPALTLAFQHLVESSEDTVALKYDVFYPNEGTATTADSFLLDRARFFISNLVLIKTDGTEVGVEEELELTFAEGDPVTIADNFAKLDRAIFTARKMGTVKTEGLFTSLRFTLGLEEFLQNKEITSDLPNGHPLLTSDTLSYEEGTGYVPNLLIVRYDTISVKDPLEFRFFTPLSITLPLTEPLVVEKGFDIRLTLKTDYMAWFSGVDLAADPPQTIQERIGQNLLSAFSVVEIRLE